MHPFPHHHPGGSGEPSARETNLQLGGVSLVVVFSLGLALVLIAIGIAMVKAASFAGRYLGDGLTDRISKRAGVASAVVVTLLGVAMTGRAVLEVAGVHLW